MSVRVVGLLMLFVVQKWRVCPKVTENTFLNTFFHNLLQRLQTVINFILHVIDNKVLQNKGC